MILRVFPRKTSMTPVDDLVVIGEPTLFEPRACVNEVHVSCVFTWDIPYCKALQENWRAYYDTVKIGGPAFGIDQNDTFIPGRYLKKGATITTRGCNFNCSWCLVPEKEGKFRELSKIAEGHIIQDNNILQSSRQHLEKVFRMLSCQHGITFTGGIDCRLVKDWHIQRLRSLKIREMWLALDCDERMPVFERVCRRLRAEGFRRNQVRTYVLAGMNEAVMNAETRLRFAYECGALPFIQPYQHDGLRVHDLRESDRQFIRSWSRPAAIKTMMGKGND